MGYVPLLMRTLGFGIRDGLSNDSQGEDSASTTGGKPGAPGVTTRDLERGSAVACAVITAAGGRVRAHDKHPYGGEWGRSAGRQRVWNEALEPRYESP